MKKLIYALIFLSCTLANAQNQNWVATAIDGNRYDIDSLVNAGKTVLVDVSAYWCAPCWDIHLSGVLDKLYHEFGPDGTNDLFIIFVDGDNGSSIANLSGAGPAALGDWITGTQYPIIGPYGQGHYVQTQYAMNGYPSLFVHCPGSSAGVSIPIDTSWTQFLHNWDSICPASFNHGLKDLTVLQTKDKEFCNGEHPVTQIFNQGMDVINTATVNVSLNGTLLQTKNWTGTLNRFESADVKFENVNLQDALEYTFDVSTPQETYTNGNEEIQSWRVGAEAPTYDLTFDLQCNSSASQTSWRLLDDNGNIVEHGPIGSNYVYNNFYTYDWHLVPNSCYTLIVRNEYGEGICCRLGNGYYNLRSTADSSLSFLFGGNFTGYEESRTFHTPLIANTSFIVKENALTIQPNPATTIITFQNSTAAITEIKIYDLLGQLQGMVLNASQVDISMLPAGMYISKVKSNEKYYTLKFSKNN
ncbi:MAG: T9SS type A sorting domain-containing protein [Bacteroidia bacterium]